VKTLAGLIPCPIPFIPYLFLIKKDNYAEITEVYPEKPKNFA